MKKRLVKKKEKRIRRDVYKIMDLVLDINGLEQRKHGITGNKPTAFLSFDGHVASVTVSVYERGWDSKFGTNFCGKCYLDKNMGTEFEISTLLEGVTEEKRKLCRN